jgi:hypothetical protein
MTLPDGEPIPFMGWVNDIEGEEMNENQKKTTEQYRSNFDNIFKKKQNDEPKKQEDKPSPRD